MIRIYAMKTDALPRTDWTLEQLSFDVTDAKREALLHGRKETAAASSAGLYLLHLLSLDAGISLSGKVLAYESGGRPYFPDAPIDFSITHTSSLVACALSVGKSSSLGRIGLDAEVLCGRSPRSMERITARFFSDGERARFLASPDESTFLEIWTAKEALCKQSGIGLSGLSQCDSLASPSHLTLYRLPSAILTLASPPGATPPSEIEIVG